MFQISGFYLKYIQAILPETSPYLSAQMAVLSSFFQMFIVLGMYNFAFTSKESLRQVVLTYQTKINYRLRHTDATRLILVHA